MQRKYIVVTGGVLSGLGKGIAMASIGNILSSSYKVVPIKCDGYLNVDGGTIGDMENELYLDAVRSLARKVGRENILFVHLTYVPIPYGVDEQKSKPTQQSVNLLRQRGIDPDVVIARCSEMLTDSIKGKIAKFGNLDFDKVLTGIDVDDVYKIPLSFEEQGMSQLIARRLNMPIRVDLDRWKCLIEKRERATREIVVGIAGKYTSLEDSYASIIEALRHCEATLGVRVKLRWIDTEKDDCCNLDGVDGVIVPGGFGSRGVEGKIDVVKFCREKGVPFLG